MSSRLLKDILCKYKLIYFAVLINFVKNSGLFTKRKSFRLLFYLSLILVEQVERKILSLIPVE